ncbi:hypothetical protein [Kitasatospora aureofaciens]|uniref:hypothetical protein n=1 Tax=Kitasatospora aureofaciens TaxID=1894 RepID=UPI001C484473|nr:hypothetical protein [Kitasatospora aureofaciens]MBV6699754.1 hypothetical protein [Kitasatospora aureofaciens]
MADETPTQYQSYSWEDDNGIQYVALYPGDKEADEERKAELRTMGARVAADLVAEQEAEREAEQEAERAKPSLRLVRGEGSS